MQLRRKWLVGAGVWTLLGLLSASQRVAFFTFSERPYELADVVGRTMLDWYTCGIFTPVIFYVARRFPFQARTWPVSVLVHLAAAGLFIMLKLALFLPLARAAGWITGPIRPSEWLLNDTFPLLIAYAAVVGVCYSIDYYERYRERLVRTAELESRLARVQLDALRAQLHPHFLFNALNALSTLIHRDADAADRMVLELGELLRQTTSPEMRPEVTLNEELRFVERYLAIMQIRFGDRLRIAYHVEPDTRDALLPTLLLQPLVENAIVHGIGRSASAGELVIRAQRDDDRLLVEVLDDGPGPMQREVAERVGLRNARMLLEQLYGKQQLLELKQRDGRGAIARVELPFHKSEWRSESPV